MTKNQFLERLEQDLSLLPYDERRDILYDYEEHFNEKIKLGLFEEDIATVLGSPSDIARKYLPDLPAVIESGTEKEENETIQPKESPQDYKPEPQPRRQDHSQYEPQYMPPKGNSSGTQLVLAFILVLLNLIFILPIYIGILAANIGLIVAFFSTAVVGIVVLLSFIFATPFVSMSIPLAFIEFPVLGISASLALISLSGLLLILFIYTFKLIIQFTGIYIRWNGCIIRGY